MEEGEFQDMFEQIKREFFPKWDRKGEWKTEWVSDINGALGKCDIATKTILMTYPCRKMFIHEICHAVADGGHTKRWSNRLLKAAKRADELGYTELGKSLFDEHQLYEFNSYTPTAAITYETIEDIASESGQPYEQVIDYCARDIGMTVTEFEQKYRLCKRAYRKGIAQHTGE